MKQEIVDLKRQDAEMEQLSHTEDHILFLKNFRYFFVPTEPTPFFTIATKTRIHCDDVRKSVLQLQNKLEDFCKEATGKISGKVRYIKVILTSDEEEDEDEDEDEFKCKVSRCRYFTSLESRSRSFREPGSKPRHSSTLESRFRSFREPGSQPRPFSALESWSRRSRESLSGQNLHIERDTWLRPSTTQN